MNWTLLYIAAACALIDWIAVWRRWRIVEYCFKPATIIALLAWLIQITGLHGQATWFAFGLLFSLLGDIFLMLPGNLFLAGLAAFLIAQLAYASGFNPNLPPITFPTILIAAVIAMVAVALYRRVTLSIVSKPGSIGLRRGILAYSIAITLMLLSAVLTIFRPEWSLRLAGYAAAGGVLFFISDAILALNRFVRRIPYGRLLNMVAYHAGQILIIVGVARHILID